MKHPVAKLCAVMIPILGLGSCSSQKAALKEQNENELQEVPEKKLDENSVRHRKVVYGPPPATYRKMEIEGSDGD